MIIPELLVLETKSVAGPKISPNGEQIVYTLGYTDPEARVGHSDLWLMATDGSENRQLSWDYDRVSSPVWRPDGLAIAFVASHGSEHSIRLLEMDGGESRHIVTHSNPPMALAWSPDGEELAYTLKVDPENPNGEKPSRPSPVRATTRLDYKQDGRGFLDNARHQLQVVDITTGEVRQLSTAYNDHDFPQWSPDGSTISVKVSSQNGMQNTIHLFPRNGGEPTVIGWEAGVIGVWSYSPDGSQILFSGYPTNSPQHEFYRYIVASGEVVQSTENLDFTPEAGYPTVGGPAQPVWIDDDKVIINAHFQGMTSLFALDVTDGVDLQITIWEAAHSGLSVDNANSTIVQTAASPEGPSRLVAVDLQSHHVTTLLDPNEELLPRESLAQVEQISIERAGERIDAWVNLPADFVSSNQYPVILDIHGGPHGNHGFTWQASAQMLASAGYIVVCPNPRGSGTYGREFAESVWGDWGGGDWQDILAVLDHVLEREYTDAKRCGIMGYSYGGYMTSWAIGQTNRFKAAVVGAPVFNFASFFGTSDIGHCWAEIQWQGSPWDPADCERVMAHSPSAQIANAVTPTLILHGEADDRCPIGQGEELFVALKRNGVETEFVRYPGGSHLMLRFAPAEYRIDYLRRVRDWFDRYL